MTARQTAEITKTGTAADSGIVIHTARGGDPCRLCAFYYHIFADQYRFRERWEGYFIKSVGEYFDDMEHNQIWLAEKNGTVVGSIGTVSHSDRSAQLRWFGVDRSMRGCGIGNDLLEQCLTGCEQNGFRDLWLWTIDILKPARHLYARHGFVMTETKPNTEWADYAMTEEKWERNSTSPTDGSEADPQA
ncbi:MAG: GNAT family N-acetyltransferase [Anaerovoracaceae bacterium]|jgi:N-acetylglutamate synthase-like GNAT family acetyltransferase